MAPRLADDLLVCADCLGPIHYVDELSMYFHNDPIGKPELQTVARTIMAKAPVQENLTQEPPISYRHAVD